MDRPFIYAALLFCLLLSTLAYGDSKSGEDHRILTLDVYEPPKNERRSISQAPTSEMVHNTIYSLKWDDITFVVLQIDDQNWIEGSGSVNPRDGLSARYMENGVEHVSNGAPESLRVINALLQSYLENNDKWRTIVSWQ